MSYHALSVMPFWPLLQRRQLYWAHLDICCLYLLLVAQICLLNSERIHLVFLSQLLKT